MLHFKDLSYGFCMSHIESITKYFYKICTVNFFPIHYITGNCLHKNYIYFYVLILCSSALLNVCIVCVTFIIYSFEFSRYTYYDLQKQFYSFFNDYVSCFFSYMITLGKMQYGIKL